MAIGNALGNALGLPGTQNLQGYVERWSPNPGEFAMVDKFPSVNYTTEDIEFDAKGSARGMTHAHTPNTPAKRVPFPILKTFKERTRYWKEEGVLTETDIQRIRAAGNRQRLAGDELARDLTNQLNIRRFTRMEYLIWSLFQNRLSIDDNGVVFSLDYTGLVNEMDADTDWSTIASADPIIDLQAAVKMLRGKAGMGGVDVYYNQDVAEYLANNAKVRTLIQASQNITDIATGNVGNLLSRMVTGVGSMNLYDGGYNNDSGTFTTFLDSDKVVLVGKPPAGQRLGHFAMTPSVHNGGLSPKAGPFVITNDNLNENPPEWSQMQGFNGIPALEFPEVVIVMTVTGV